MKISSDFESSRQLLDHRHARFLAKTVEQFIESANEKGQEKELDNEAEKLITSALMELAKAKGYLADPEKRQQLFADAGKQFYRDQALDRLHAAQTTALERAQKAMRGPVPNARKILTQLSYDLNAAWTEYRADPSVSSDGP